MIKLSISIVNAWPSTIIEEVELYNHLAVVEVAVKWKVFGILMNDIGGYLPCLPGCCILVDIDVSKDVINDICL